ncbi:MAG: hypothetical protein ACI30R_10140 [Sodaliphilus sp.]
MNKLIKSAKKIVLLLLLAWLPIAALADDAQLWNGANALSIDALLHGSEGTSAQCTPVKKDGLAPVTRNAVNFYECSAMLEKSTGVVYKQIENEFSYYYVLFAGVKDIRMGKNPSQFEMECADASGAPIYLAYDMVSNTATRLPDRSLPNAKRIANSTPQLVYKQNGSMYKDFRNYFKCLAAGEYADALAKRNDIYANLNKDTYKAYPLWELGEAMLLSYPANYTKSGMPPRDLMKAYNYVAEVFRTDKYISEANTLMALSEIRLSAGAIKTKIENELIDEARRQHTEAAYDQILEVLYESPVYAQARTEQEQIAMKKLGDSENLDLIFNYLNKYRYVNNDNTKIVENRLYTVEYKRMGSKWTDCSTYLNKYPLSPYADEVRSMLHDRQFSQISCAADCKAFLDAHPESPRCNEVWLKYADLAFQELPDDEAALNKYLEDFAFANKKKEVEERILNIRYKKAIQEGTEEAYDEFLANNRYNKYTDEIEELRKAFTADEEGDAEEEFEDEEPAVTKSTTKRTYVKKPKKRSTSTPGAKQKTPAPQKKKSTTVSDFKKLIGG